jgi:hypothetical protein
MGLPGATKCQVMLSSSAQASMALDVNSVPLSETIIPGLRGCSISVVNSRATPSRDRCVRDRRQAFPADVIDDV